MQGNVLKLLPFQGVLLEAPCPSAWVYIVSVVPTRPERAETPSPGQRPGYKAFVTLRPVRAKALKPSLYWFHFLANLFHAAESEGLGGASFGIRICLTVPSLFLTS